MSTYTLKRIWDHHLQTVVWAVEAQSGAEFDPGVCGYLFHSYEAAARFLAGEGFRMEGKAGAAYIWKRSA